MNKIELTGRLTRDPDTRDNGNSVVTHYGLAVPRKYKKEGEPDADFVNCTAFGGQANYADKYFKKGMRVEVAGRIRTGSYTNRDGIKVPTVEVIVEEHAILQSKSERSEAPTEAPAKKKTDDGGFSSIPEGLEGFDLPFD